jgi:uncharacterized protein (TIGR04255 family)
MGHTYTNPPILEALCQFQFIPDQPWDWTVPGLLYDRLKVSYPNKRQQNMFEVEYRPEQQEISQRVKSGVARMQFIRADERALVQVGPDLLVINHLRPYPKWDVFIVMISEAVAHYQAVATPKAIKSIGLRYINRIETPEPDFEIESYLLAAPKVPESVPQVFHVFAQRVEIPFPEQNGLLIMQTGMERNADGKVALMLDLDLVTLEAASIMPDNSMDWVAQAHLVIENVFEACITDKARSLFKGEQ